MQVGSCPAAAPGFRRRGAVGRDKRGDLAATTTYGEFLVAGWRCWPFPLAVVFCSLWLLSLCSVRRVRGREAFVAALAGAVRLRPVLHALLSAIMLLLHGWRNGGVAQAFVVAPPLVLFAFSLAVVVLIGMMGRDRPRASANGGAGSAPGSRSTARRGWWSRSPPSTAAVALRGVHAPPWKALSAARWLVGTVGAGLSPGTPIRPAGHEKTAQAAQPAAAARRAVAPFLFIAGLLIGVVTCSIDRHEQRRPDWWHADRRRRRTAFFRVSLGASTAVAADALPARLPRRHQRVQPQRVLPQPAGALLPRRHARRSRASASRRTSPASTTTDDIEPGASCRARMASLSTGRSTSSTAR